MIDTPMGAIRVSFAALALLIGLGLIYLGVGFVQDARELSGMEPVPADEIASEEGEIIMEGVARPSEGSSLLETKYRGVEAIAHEWEVEREEERDPNSETTTTTWATVDSGQGSVDFYVKDDSGRALVETDSINLKLDTRTVRREGDRRYRDGALEPGEEVFVRGVVNTEDIEPYVGTGDEVGRVVVRDGDKEEAVLTKYAGAGAMLLFGLVFSSVGAFVIRRDFKEGS